MFLNKMLNFSNPVSLTCEPLHGVSLVLGCWAPSPPRFSLFLSVSVFPLSMCLVVDESTHAGCVHGERSAGCWCAREFSERENLPDCFLMLDLLLLQWEALWFCFPSLMLKQKLYLWATVFGMGLFQL